MKFLILFSLVQLLFLVDALTQLINVIIPSINELFDFYNNLKSLPPIIIVSKNKKENTKKEND